MSWSYSGDPGASALDEVRFVIQDTDSADQLLSDEELAYLITAYDGDPYAAAISAVTVLIGKASRVAEESKKVGDLSLTRKTGARVAQWEQLLKVLQNERFRRLPAAPVANPNALLPTDIGIVEGEGTDYVIGQMDNRT
jgi:hypothetical protein